MIKEKNIQEAIKQEASAKGHILWRNNLGVFIDPIKKKFVRYGLANESKQMNDYIKSSDLIGIKKVTITQDMVGKTIGQFMCREIKNSSWKYKGTIRELAQKRWIDLVNSYGGDAKFVNEVGSI